MIGDDPMSKKKSQAEMVRLREHRSLEGEAIVRCVRGAFTVHLEGDVSGA